MATREFLIDPAKINFDQIVADIDSIREVIPQRGSFEHLTAIIVDDFDRHLCVGYKDVGEDEFWVCGHMPGMPLMPGVLMCEAAAQLFSFYIQRHDLSGAPVLGLGGLDDVRFRDVVRPGDRLVIACQSMKIRPGKVMQCRFQGFVRMAIVCEGSIVGVPLRSDLSHSRFNSPRGELTTAT